MDAPLSNTMKVVTYNKDAYTLSMWSPDKVLTMFTRLFKLVGPSIPAMMKDEKEVDTSAAFKEIVDALVFNMDEQKVVRLVHDCLEGIYINQKVELEPVFNNHFMGKMDELIKLLGDQLKFQFVESGFLKGAGKRVTAFIPGMK